jgi:hypothetical protein
LQQKVKELEEKLLMIAEVVKSDEDYQLKVQLIADLLNVPISHEKQ